MPAPLKASATALRLTLFFAVTTLPTQAQTPQSTPASALPEAIHTAQHAPAKALALTRQLLNEHPT